MAWDMCGVGVRWWERWNAKRIGQPSPAVGSHGWSRTLGRRLKDGKRRSNDCWWSVGRSVATGSPGALSGSPGALPDEASELASVPLAGRALGERGRAPGEPESKDGPKGRRQPSDRRHSSIHRPAPPHQTHTTTRAHITRTPAHTCARA